jgi:hypothetical protein
MSRNARRDWALLVVVLLASASMSSMVRAQSLADIVRYSPVGWEIAAGPDGRLWEAGGLRVGWLDDLGNLTQATGLGEQPTSSGPLVPLTDGSMAFVALFGRSASDFRLGVVHLHAGAAPTMSPVPIDLVRVPEETALRPDGTLMIDDLCHDSAIEVDPRGVVTYVRLRHRRCVGEGGGAIAVGEDGTTWDMNGCDGRIVRIPLVGRPRQWSFAPVRKYCAPDSPHYIPLDLSIEPTPSGGLLTPDLRVSAGGRLTIEKSDLPIARTPDGSVWTNVGGKLIQRGPSGTMRRWPWQAIAATAGPDGRLWYTRAHVEINPAAILDPNVGGIYWSAWDTRVGAIDPRSGSVTEQPLPPYGPDRANSPIMTAAPTIVAGPDDSVWLTEHREADGDFSQFLIRLTPARSASVRPSIAIAARVLGRARHVLWLQLRCTGRPGRYCVGAATVAAGRLKLSRRATTFSFPAGSSQPVLVRLTAQARRSLRPGAVVQARVRTKTSTGWVLRQRVLRLPRQ